MMFSHNRSSLESKNSKDFRGSDIQSFARSWSSSSNTTTTTTTSQTINDGCKNDISDDGEKSEPRSIGPIEAEEEEEGKEGEGEGEIAKSGLTKTDETSVLRTPQFSIDLEINKILRTALEGQEPWECPLIEAIAIAANEDLMGDEQPIASRKYRKEAGTIEINENFEEQGFGKQKARTGDCVQTSAGRIAGVKSLVHCIVPRYVEKYKTAAETALVHCYRNALSMCIEEDVNARNVALTLLHQDPKKNYPIKEGAVVLARSVRKFLEKWHKKFDSVVLLFPDEETKIFYEREIFPLYFPRNAIELNKSRDEAQECDENGERVIEGRTISIASFPSMPTIAQQQQQMASDADDEEEDTDSFDDVSEESKDVSEDEEQANNNKIKKNNLAVERSPKRSTYGKGLIRADKNSVSNKSMSNLSEVLNVPIGVTIATPATGATFMSQHETPEERRFREFAQRQGTIEPWLFNETNKLNANYDRCISSVEDTSILEHEEIEYAKLLRVASHSLDELSMIEFATRAVTLEKALDFAGRRIITIVGAFAERMIRDGDEKMLFMSLANNVVLASQEGSSSGFIIVYHHTGGNSDSLTTEQFEMLLTKALGPAHCQAQLKALYLVHCGTKMKARCWWSSLGFNRNDGACAALSKSVYVNTLDELNAYLRIQEGGEIEIPAHVKDFNTSVALKGVWY